MARFFCLREKTYSYLIDDGSDVKKTKCTKSVSWKENWKLKITRNYLEVTQLENKIYYLEKNKIEIDVDI